jgi:hypothetical protein
MLSFDNMPEYMHVWTAAGVHLRVTVPRVTMKARRD